MLLHHGTVLVLSGHVCVTFYFLQKLIGASDVSTWSMELFILH